MQISKSRWRMGLLLIGAFLSLGGSFPSLNREIYDKAQCRVSYGRSVRVLSSSLSLRVQACQRERLRGHLPASLDCGDPWSWASAGYTAGNDGFVHDLYRYDLESAVCTATVTQPTQVGYVSCPAPCDGITVTTFADFGACLKCLNQPLAVTAWTTAIGSPPVSGDPKVGTCQTAIARSIFRYVGKLMKLQTACEFKHEVSKDGFENFQCANLRELGHPLATRINRYRARLVDLITRGCAEVDIPTQLDTCGSDSAAVGECVAAAVDTWVETMHPPIYPPLPPP